MKLVTEEDKKIIAQKYATTDTEDLAKELGFSPSTIKNWAAKLGVKKKKGYIYHNIGKFTKEEKRYIYNFYSIKTNEELSKELNKSIDDILGYACAKGLKKQADLFKNIRGSYQFFINKRNTKDYNYTKFLGNNKEPTISQEQLYKAPHGKYFINKDYFNQVDNEWKAYWLGFLYADGWNTPQRCQIGVNLALKDKGHLERFLLSLQSDYPIHITKPKELIIRGNKTNSYGEARLMISNKTISEDLDRLGCVFHKTSCLIFPNENIVPKYLMRHFIRGFFDGDGWVCTLKNKKAPSVGFVGAKDFIICLSNYLIKELDLTPVKYSQKENCKIIEIDWHSLIDVERIFNYFYNNSNIFLQRKFEKLNNFYCLGQYEV